MMKNLQLDAFLCVLFIEIVCVGKYLPHKFLIKKETPLCYINRKSLRKIAGNLTTIVKGKKLFWQNNSVSVCVYGSPLNTDFALYGHKRVNMIHIYQTNT